MKARFAVLLILGIVIIDQVLKIYVKTHFNYGEHKNIAGDWFRLNLVENEGMAWGWKLGGSFGKLFLTLFRIVAVIWGSFFLAKLIKKSQSRAYIVSACLIYAGALGNLIDSTFYGKMFDRGTYFDRLNNYYQSYSGLAEFSNTGYASFLHGNVVDMLYFPIFRGHFPSWFPFWGGQGFEFFNMVFNIADASITIGVIILFLFQKKIFNKLSVAELPAVTPVKSANETNSI
jgi:signal peptidase II